MGRLIICLLRFTRLILTLLLGVFYAFGFILCGVLSPISLKRRQKATRWFLASLARCLPFRVSVKGAIPERPGLWLSNHVSWTDIPLLGQFVPISFLSKAEVKDWPIAGLLTRQSGTLFIQRGQGASQALQADLRRYLRDGRHLAIFPEGTTTDGRQVRTFHSRLLSCATDAGIPIQPVAIRYVRNGEIDTVAPFIGDDDMLSHLKRLFLNATAQVEIEFLPVIETAGRDRNSIARQAQYSIEQILQRPVSQSSGTPALAA